MTDARATLPWRPSPAVVVSITSVAAALLVGAALIAALGVPVGEAVDAFADGAWGSAYAIGASINRSLVFALVGTGFVLAQRAALTNVGGEGQIAIGGIAATAVALSAGVATLPAPLPWLLPLAVAALCGGAWGAIAGALRVRMGTNEVISTLLLSFIAVWMLYGSVQSTALLRQPMTGSATLPESLSVPDATQLPLLGADASLPLHAGLPLALLLIAGVALVLSRTALGVRLAAVGLNAEAARRAGIPIAASVVGAMFTAGALGGLAGGFMLLGDQTVLKAGFSSGYGFDGLVVGLLARGSIVGVLAAALLFGFLRSGGINMEMVAGVPTALVAVIQGLVILVLAGAAIVIDRKAVAR